MTLTHMLLRADIEGKLYVMVGRILRYWTSIFAAEIPRFESVITRIRQLITY